MLFFSQIEKIYLNDEEPISNKNENYDKNYNVL